MLDDTMRRAYLSAFQYDDIDNTALPGEVDRMPRVGDEGVITWAVSRYTPDGLWQDMEYEEQLFRIGVMEPSGLPVIECRDDTGAEWDDYPPLVFDLLDSAGDAATPLYQGGAARLLGVGFTLAGTDRDLIGRQVEDGLRALLDVPTDGLEKVL